MSLARFRRERKSAVAVLFACLALPIVGLLGIAIDFGLWNQTSSSLSLAASGAALNAVKIAATGQLAADPNYLAEGTTSGTQWFEVQAAHNAGNLVNVVPTVTVTGTTSISASVTYTGTIKSIFGSLFAIRQYPINVAASATITTAPYLNIEILMDNSSSMQIGATPNDIEAMQYATPCSTLNEETGTGTVISQGASGQNFSAYQTSGYNGTLNAPILQAQLNFPYNLPQGVLTATGSTTGPSCTKLNGTSPYAGPPCAFACHFDNSKTAGLGNDFFSLARSTLTYSSTPCATQSAVTPGKCAVTLRFDLVKQAMNQVISQMQTDDLAIDNLNVGIFALPGPTGGTGPFAYVTPVYPGCTTAPYNTVACQAGGAWATATSDVGVTPTKPNTAEPGIQPAYWSGSASVTGDTDFHDAMTAMTTQLLTASGDGTTAATPVKVLFLVTDGMADYTPASGSRVNGAAINPSDCQLFKNLGYTVYVVYTPYYPLMNAFYIDNIASIAEPLATSTLATNLQACSSGNSYYIEANPTDASSIKTALQTFLQRALAESPARFTL